MGEEINFQGTHKKIQEKLNICYYKETPSNKPSKQDIEDLEKS